MVAKTNSSGSPLHSALLHSPQATKWLVMPFPPRTETFLTGDVITLYNRMEQRKAHKPLFLHKIAVKPENNGPGLSYSF